MRARPRIVAIVQARVGSVRLPGKVLRPLGDEPLIGHVLRRVTRVRGLDKIVLATSAAAEDHVLADVGRRYGVTVHASHPPGDVLGRFVAAAEATGARIVVRICGDEPFVDPAIVEAALAQLLSEHPDYVGTTLTRVVPVGLDVEVFTREMLDDLDRRASLARHREHVTLFAMETPALYRMVPFAMTPPLPLVLVRFTVDTEADFAVAEAVLRAFGGRTDVSAAELTAWALSAIPAGIPA